ncbi:hypothetical protein SAMN02745206_00182 [Desulfacinum infernum DSM 9756]|jgi:hypothetical protein|uniref:Uncharacterized protein n=1 Tax=Desulfacinum infernum DSM 9756 TaxID=1121391 RepID=A0A1M4STL8_9BACT|nr:hypothetical protein [Desulfacinum infernum]MBC7357576.1 hypothetical protein [Desulfacinum sp.]MBZ4660299.1 hypothetical protein [Desulfacinum sp.]SHE35536.1 hypothetical protein SAMN02745206_00182 [Desulfacinum infernum DSM 9756]
MNVHPKIVAAITAAVALYMQAHQQVVQEGAPPEVKRETPPAPAVTFSPWTLSGRQSMMDMRRMLQMRLVR